MNIMKEYGISLLKALVSFIVLLALVNLIKNTNWELLLNYYLISNYIMLYPFNQRFLEKKSVDIRENDEKLSRTRKSKDSGPRVDSNEEQDTMSRVKNVQTIKNDPRDLLMNTGLSFIKYVFLIICAPVIFMQFYLLGKNIL
ncbi:hypothetical protein FC19_GL000969 [Liquorilactobacillus aquaticus DSM 21051]|uniref:Uncharacterized protein n=1 Tax=Liquorilactobacillus aquaticus DSM 21051 TaxID=1423725 RepID=A0A0R2CXJ1_9LACO|nr:hypothetical protein [Liquorilactobacillus aquaticus]KRM96671.1 hypothetical protein FC19_GL000969 [Liquorilactobacillus aquaticus DSM 21051]